MSPPPEPDAPAPSEPDEPAPSAHGASHAHGRSASDSPAAPATPAQSERGEPPPSAPPQPTPPLGPVVLRAATGPLLAPLLSRVTSMVLARVDCPLDRLEDALILCDAIAAHAPAHARDRHISFTLDEGSGSIELRVGELSTGGASGLIDDAQLPDVGNVIERFSEARRIEPSADRLGEELVLRLDFG